ncbi:DUF6575 domain-containing protein [Microbacterium laevaniformans]|uniref:DUF6575 domain-containing protein n=1 Tax=Microbacterium laevaniformans TaxID=36807 RepID=UPI00363100E5
MSWLPRDTALGVLDIDEIYAEYEGPRVFSARSRTGQAYLAEWAEEGASADTWLYVPVSAARLSMVRSGAWTLRRAFEAPEDRLWVVRLPHDMQEPDSAVPALSVQDSWLPGDDFRIELPTPTLPAAVGLKELWQRAAAEGRSRLRIEISDPSRLRSEASTRRIGPMLTSTQGVLDNFGLVEFEQDPPQRGRIGREVLDRMETEVIELAAASFVIEIASSDGQDLFGDSPVGRAMEKLVGLLAVDLPADMLVEQLVALRPRGAKSFRHFVAGLASLGADVAVATANAARQAHEERLTADQVQNLKELLNTVVPNEVAEVRGRMRLYRADMERKLFGLEDLDSGAMFEGTIASRALGQVDSAVINKTYEVVLSEFSTFDQAVGEAKPKHVLEQLVPSESDVPVPLERVVITQGPEDSSPIFD